MSRTLYDDIGEQFVNQYAISIGQMFGKPCLKINNKAFAVFFKDEMVFKLGQREIDLLKTHYSNSVNWDPSGKNRPMKDWLQISITDSNDWTKLAKQALHYVEGIN
ncbi:MAG: hypothetical protein JKY48_07920 [Flavobacteriales bacterium]|nr:hypothetical protein [Flavobacteriales bacterium]